MVFDFLKPYYYKAEKAVAAQSIPPVHQIEGRQTLKDCNKSGDTFDHSLWNAVLQAHVDTSGTTINDVQGIHTVDYQGVTLDPKFEQYLDKLATAEPSKLSGPEQLAFYMNAYNALCINLIVQHEKKSNEQLKSINNLSKDGKAVWDQTAGTVAGKQVSLNHIEHEKLRGTWAEPAVHGCIVCASASCPNLRKEAFVGSHVKEQMDDQMKMWMKNDTKGLKLTTTQGLLGNKREQLELSRIFLWFADDFGGWKGLQQWLTQYVADKDVKTAIASDNVKVRYFEYDWNMNRAQK